MHTISKRARNIAYRRRHPGAPWGEHCADHRMFFISPNAAAARRCSKRWTRRLGRRRVRSILRALVTLVCCNQWHQGAKYT